MTLNWYIPEGFKNRAGISEHPLLHFLLRILPGAPLFNHLNKLKCENIIFLWQQYKIKHIRKIPAFNPNLLGYIVEHLLRRKQLFLL